VVVGAAVSVAPAHADEADDRFIEQLDWKGVPYTNPTEVIRLAKQYCLARTRQNTSPWSANRKVERAMEWSGAEVDNFARAAVPAYCPGAW
jgi:hypothetical protein